MLGDYLKASWRFWAGWVLFTGLGFAVLGLQIRFDYLEWPAITVLTGYLFGQATIIAGAAAALGPTFFASRQGRIEPKLVERDPLSAITNLEAEFNDLRTHLVAVQALLGRLNEAVAPVLADLHNQVTREQPSTERTESQSAGSSLEEREMGQESKSPDQEA